jgi:biopolymer transport protein ExbD
MLDLVLQLIMFFMLVTNFLADDLNESVRLPHALQARPLDKSEDYVITLNVDSKGRVLLTKGSEKMFDEMQKTNPELYRKSVLTNKEQVASYMKVKWEADKNRIDKAEERGAKEKPRPSLVVLRAHENATFKMVNEVLEGCRMAKYTDVQLRAIVGKGN